MKSFFLLFFTTMLGCAVSGCSLTGTGCTMVGCFDTAHVSLTGLVTRYGVSAPLSIKMCVDGASCVTAQILEVDGALTCAITSGADPSGCLINTNGKDVDAILALDAQAIKKASVTISVSVTDGMNAKLFEGEKSTALDSVTPNGPGCEPTCHQGAVSFTL
jgi:hypothetical protein